QTQPQEEGQARVRTVLGEFAAQGQVGLLDHVGGIDAALQPAVHAQPDHALEPVTVALDQDCEGVLVAVAGGVQQLLVSSSVGAHSGVHTPLHGTSGGTFTALERILCRPPMTPASLPGGLASRNDAARSGGGVSVMIVKASGVTRRSPLTARN